MSTKSKTVFEEFVTVVISFAAGVVVTLAAVGQVMS